MDKKRAPNNRTLTVDEAEKKALQSGITKARSPLSIKDMVDKTFNENLFEVIEFFPHKSVDLLIIDPPYNLTKNFNGLKFTQSNDNDYLAYLESWFPQVVALLKDNGSLYLCGDWRSSSPLYQIVNKYLLVRNRITWQREKGRGAKANWKNCTEDIWFATVSNNYYFNVEAVKIKRQVLAPYREKGQPKDWEETENGNFRLTHPSNFWDDITIPYWSMPENADHPTQKSEKLIAKLILASCPPGGLVFDPFLGSGTTSVVAKKLGRKYCGIEIDKEYCLWALKRLKQADRDRTIQGYSDGVFWERNTLKFQKESYSPEGAADFAKAKSIRG